MNIHLIHVLLHKVFVKLLSKMHVPGVLLYIRLDISEDKGKGAYLFMTQCTDGPEVINVHSAFIQDLK